MMVAGLGVSFGLRLIIQRFKERSTYPRTGYAAPLTGLEHKGSAALVVAFTLVLLGLNYYLSTQGDQGLLWSPAVAGLVFAFLFAWTGAFTKIRRFYFLALFSGCAGLALAALRMDYFRGVGVLAGVVGLILIYQGYRARQAYIRESPPISHPIHE
jgi:sulfite exporter TauE/SafE